MEPIEWAVIGVLIAAGVGILGTVLVGLFLLAHKKRSDDGI